MLVDKAGAYVLVNHVMPFVMGPTPDHSALAIARLGGHREGQETAWECARREVFEESRMRIAHCTPLMTFECPHKALDTDIVLEPVRDDHAYGDGARPLIVGRPDVIQRVTAMFVATSDDAPVPNMETHALILLTRQDVLRICSEALTLEAFQAAGGTVLLARPVDPHWLLKPLGQLLMLARIIESYPAVIPRSLFP